MAPPRHSGFTLIEVMIAVVIVGILASIAYPSYIGSITKSKRRAAAACLSSYATHMERFYTSNLRYDKDIAGADVTLPALECATNSEYTFSITAVTRTTYSLSATPKSGSAQAQRDTKCGSLSVNQAGTRTASGSGADCW